jgi:hypothetical protein
MEAVGDHLKSIGVGLLGLAVEGVLFTHNPNSNPKTLKMKLTMVAVAAVVGAMIFYIEGKILDSWDSIKKTLALSAAIGAVGVGFLALSAIRSEVKMGMSFNWTFEHNGKSS